MMQRTMQRMGKMSTAKKFKKMHKATDKLETQLQSNLKKEYKKAFDAIRLEILKAENRGFLSATEFYKYQRDKKLMQEINSILKNITAMDNQHFKTYLANQYENNYFGTGFIMETEYQAKLAYRHLDRKAVRQTVVSPLTNISLQNNRARVLQSIRSTLAQAAIKGDSLAVINRNIKKDLETNANNSLRIARTETTTIAGKGQQESMEHAEKKLPIIKKWIATLDGRTRDRHGDMDGETVLVGKPFSNGLMYPGDQSGDAAEVINCRCTMETVVEGYENASQYRRAKGLDGKNKVIPQTTYKDWIKNRVT
jgi:SPP1 gp7 family putative phage head morphogenesis protein